MVMANLFLWLSWLLPAYAAQPSSQNPVLQPDGAALRADEAVVFISTDLDECRLQRVSALVQSSRERDVVWLHNVSDAQIRSSSDLKKLVAKARAQGSILE